MAKITVNGAVGRIFYENKGVEVIESYKSQSGELKTRKYTAWFDQPQNLSQGQSGVFEGNLSATIEAWKNPDGTPKLDNTGKPGQSIKLSINGATFTGETRSSTPLDDSFPF